MHQIEHFRRVDLTRPGFTAAQHGVASGHRAVGGEVLRAAGTWRDIDAAAREGRARVFSLQPIHDRLDAIDVGVGQVVLLAEAGRHIDMGDVVASRRIDPIQRLEEDPVAAEALGDLGEIGAVVAGEAVAQQALIVAGIGMVEAGLALQCRLAARRAVPRHRNREQRVAHRAALAQRAAAAARAFEIAGSKINALRDRAIDLVCVEAMDLRGRHRGAEDPEHRPGMKAARHHGWDELGRHPLHDLITGGNAGQELPAGAAGRLGRDQGRGKDRDARMGQHAERVPLAAGENRFRVDEGGAGLGQLRAVAQHGRGPSPARFLFLHQRKCLSARRHGMADQG